MSEAACWCEGETPLGQLLLIMYVYNVKHVGCILQSINKQITQDLIMIKLQILKDTRDLTNDRRRVMFS